MARKAKTKDNPPPATEILSVTPSFEIDESGERPSPKPELAGASESVPQTGPEFVQEPETEEPSSEQPETPEQPFTTEELGEEPTGDPLKDTQRAYHKLSEQVKEQANLIHALTVDRHMRPSPAPAAPQLPPEMTSPDPVGDEAFGVDPNFPGKFMRRQQGLMMMNLQQRDTEREMRDFVDGNKNWKEMVPVMQEVFNEEPRAYQGPGALSRLHKQAKDRRELKQLRESAARVKEESLQAGVKMGKQTRERTFVSPGAAGTAMPGKLTAPPPDFHTWDTAKQKQWLGEHGYLKPDTY